MILACLGVLPNAPSAAARTLAIAACLSLSMSAASATVATQLSGIVVYGTERAASGGPASFGYHVEFGVTGRDLWEDTESIRGLAYDDAANLVYILDGTDLYSVAYLEIGGAPTSATFRGAVRDIATGGPLDAQGLTWCARDGGLYASACDEIFRITVSSGAQPNCAIAVARLGWGAEIDGLACDARSGLFYGSNNSLTYTASLGGGTGKGLVEIDLSLGAFGVDRKIAEYPYANPAANAEGLAIDPLGRLYLIRDRSGTVFRFDVDAGVYLGSNPGNSALGTARRGQAGGAYAEELPGDLGEVYCDGNPAAMDPAHPWSNPNSLGLVGELRAAGSALVADGDVTLLASRLPSRSATLFLVGRLRSFTLMPGASLGNLCLSGPIGRFVRPGELRMADSFGRASLSIDLTSLPTPMGDAAAQPGETWTFQAWHRDAVMGAVVSNFTTAIEIMFL